jgi:hypothetical protein
VDGQYSGANFTLPLLTAQTIWRKNTQTAADHVIVVNGFDLPLGT